MNEFNKAKSFLIECKVEIVLAFALFLLSSVFGYFFSSNLIFLDDLLREILEKTSGKNTYELIFFIFQNNVTSSFFSIILGVFLGVFPIVNALLNGTVLGYVIARVSDAGFVNIFLRLAPHGIFELPAIFISIGVGMKLGMSILSRNKKNEIYRRFFGAMRVFLFIVLPLLLIGALIEGVLIGLFS